MTHHHCCSLKMALAVLAHATVLLSTLMAVAKIGDCSESSFYELTATDAAGQEVSLSSYRGQVLLFVNVASECGYTDGHYRNLVQLYRKYSQHGLFQVLAFPCNQFGQQEPKDITDIVKFVSTTYEVTFPVFSKINVIGSDVAPVWKFLEEQTGHSPDWNFWKYLVDHRGGVIGAWGPWTSVSELEPMIQTAVGAARDDIALQSDALYGENREIRQDL